MKKSLLALVALAAIGLAACGEKPTPTPDPGPTPTPAVEVPTEEGKCTFYLSIGEGNIEFKEYESIYLTGGAFGWKTGYEALEMKKLEGDSKVYYVQIANDAFDVTASQGMEYQLVIGYNEKANMPAASSGLQWVDGRKSEECAAPGGLGNLAFEYTAGDLKVNLGSHHWVNSLPTPSAPLSNYTFKVEFEEAIPDYGTVLMFGSFNGWNTPGDGKDNEKICNDATLTPNDDRTVWTLTMETLVAGDYECKILVEYAADVAANHNVSWNAVDQTQENYHFTVTQADGDNYTLDVLGEKATYKLADPNKTVAGTITVVNSGEALIATDPLVLVGDFTNWTAVPLTKVDDNTYVLTGEIKGGDHEFGVMTVTDGWKDAAVAEGGGNAKFSIEVGEHVTADITFSCDFSLFGGEAKHVGVVSEVVYDAVK